MGSGGGGGREKKREKAAYPGCYGSQATPGTSREKPPRAVPGLPSLLGWHDYPGASAQPSPAALEATLTALARPSTLREECGPLPGKGPRLSRAAGLTWGPGQRRQRGAPASLASRRLSSPRSLSLSFFPSFLPRLPPSPTPGHGHRKRKRLVGHPLDSARASLPGTEPSLAGARSRCLARPGRRSPLEGALPQPQSLPALTAGAPRGPQE